MSDLIFRPTRFFEKVKDEKIKLAIPILILFLVGIFDGVVNTLVLDETTLADVANGIFPISKVLFFILVSNLSFYGLIAIQTVLFPIIIKKLGGTGGSRKHSFYILGIAAFPLLLQSILHLLFPATVWWQYFEHRTILYFLSYSLFNVFNIWSVALLIIGFAKVYNVSYKKSSILYLQFIIKLIPFLIITILAS